MDPKSQILNPVTPQSEPKIPTSNLESPNPEPWSLNLNSEP